MSKSKISPLEAKNLSKKIFLEIHPEKDLWFDLAWEAFEERGFDLPVKGKAHVLPALAMSSDSDTAVKELIDHFAVFFEAFMVSFPVAREELLKRIQQVSQEHGEGLIATQGLVEKLNCHLPLDDGSEAQRIDLKKAAPSEKQVFVERLLKGEYTGPRSRSLRYAKSVPSRASYDLVIDERNSTLYIRPSGDDLVKRDIFKLPGMQRGMLWLVLSHVSIGYLTHEDIGTTFGYELGNRFDPQKIYQCRIQLGKLLGDALRNKVLSEGVTKTYRISKENWSFCWIREHLDSGSSLLLRGVGR